MAPFDETSCFDWLEFENYALAGLPKTQSGTITSPSDINVIDLKADMRYNYITVEAQWVGSMGTRAYGELITAEL